MRTSKKPLLVSVIVVFAMASLAVGIRWFVRARTTSACNACINKLRQIDGATQQWALEHNAVSNSVVTWRDIIPYLGRGQSSQMPKCPQGGFYTIGRVVDSPHCSIMHHNFDFGYFTVVDESGSPLADVRIAVLGQNVEICHAQTSTNGEAYLFTDW